MALVPIISRLFYIHLLVTNTINRYINLSTWVLAVLTVYYKIDFVLKDKIKIQDLNKEETTSDIYSPNIYNNP